MARNADDPDPLLLRARNLAYGMDEPPNEIRTMAELTRVPAEIAVREKNPDKAMELTSDTLERVGPLPAGGPLRRCLENALKTKAAAMSIKSPQGGKCGK